MTGEISGQGFPCTHSLCPARPSPPGLLNVCSHFRMFSDGRVGSASPPLSRRLP